MKKTFVIILSVLLLLTLCACGEPAATTGGNTTAPTQGATEPGTTVPPTVPTTAPTTVTTTHVQTMPTEPSEPTVPTTAPHTHNYSSQVVKEPGCEEQGQMAYICQCGDTYTEVIAPTGHSWGEWYVSKQPTLTEKGEAQQTCTACNAAQTKELDCRSIEEELNAYAELACNLPTFQSADELGGGFLFSWISHNVPRVKDEWNDETFQITKVYSLDAIDAVTTYYLGRTYDFLYLVDYNDDLAYDPDNNWLIWTTYGAGGGYIMSLDSYTMIDETHYTLRYIATDIGEETPAYYGTMELELVDGRFIIRSHTEQR